MDFVLDNSVAMRWVLPVRPEEAHLAEYARRVARRCEQADVGVPWFWHVEAANVLARSEKEGVIDGHAVTRLLDQLVALEIRTDYDPPGIFRGAVLALARRHARLSAYDACYLELAIRMNVPLATNDGPLAEVAMAEGVEILLGGPDWPEKPGRKSRRTR